MVDLYRIEAGPELDRLVHEWVLDNEPEGPCPPYSTDETLAKQVLKHVTRHVDSSIVTGKTRGRNGTRYFARYGTDPSTSTEVLSESYPLSICRLAALRCRNRKD